MALWYTMYRMVADNEHNLGQARLIIKGVEDDGKPTEETQTWYITETLSLHLRGECVGMSEDDIGQMIGITIYFLMGLMWVGEVSEVSLVIERKG